MTAVIEVEALTKRYAHTVAVDGLSFSLGEGTVCGFLGPNGAGKTTTFRMLLGLVAPTSGRARILGQAYRDLADPVRTVGSLLETAGFHPGRTARNHLRYFTTIAGLPASKGDELLDKVGLGHVADVRVGKYSLGMKQRLALAGALIGDPQVLILDEPSNGMDPEGMRWLRGFLREQADDAKTVIVSSHVLAEVAQTVDQALIISNGRLVLQSPMDALRARAGEGVQVRTPDARKLRRVLKASGIETERAMGDTLIVQGTTTEAVGKIAAANGIVVLELQASGGSLEDVFLGLVGSKDRELV